MPVQPTRFFLLDILDAITATAGLLDDATFHLATAGTPSPDAVPASFTEADYTGYAAQTLTDVGWGAAFLAGGLVPTVKHTMLVFAPTGGAVANTITAWYILNVAGTEVIASGILDPAVVLDGALTALHILPEMQLDPLADYGEPLTES